MNRQDDLTGPADDVSAPTFEAFATLLREMKRLNVSLVERDDFVKAQEVTALLRSVSELAERTRSIVQGEDAGEIQPSNGSGPAAGRHHVADPDGYPRYVRRGDTLVKVGLKRDKTHIYEQKLSRRDFEAIRDSLVPLARSREEFEALRVIAQVRPPSYLVYLLLGALQEAGRLASPTRGKYCFPQPLEAADFDAVWSRFPREQQEAGR